MLLIYFKFFRFLSYLHKIICHHLNQGSLQIHQIPNFLFCLPNIKRI
jgi:hypothetical protein